MQNSPGHQRAPPDWTEIWDNGNLPSDPTPSARKLDSASCRTHNGLRSSGAWERGSFPKRLAAAHGGALRGTRWGHRPAQRTQAVNSVQLPAKPTWPPDRREPRETLLAGTPRDRERRSLLERLGVAPEGAGQGKEVGQPAPQSDPTAIPGTTGPRGNPQTPASKTRAGTFLVPTQGSAAPPGETRTANPE